jgi:hypothetical protein
LSGLVITFGVLAGVAVIVGTVLFWFIYKEAAELAEYIQQGIAAVGTITDQQQREMHSRGFDVETYIREQKFNRALAKLVTVPFGRKKRAELGFGLYVLGAIFAAISVIISASH